MASFAWEGEAFHVAPTSAKVSSRMQRTARHVSRSSLLPERLLARWRVGPAQFATSSGADKTLESRLSHHQSEASPSTAVEVPERARYRAPAAAVPQVAAPAGNTQPELLKQYLSETCMSSAERTRLALTAAREAFARHPSDCGSTEVQGVCRPCALGGASV